MKREILLKITSDYDNVSDEDILEDSGIYDLLNEFKIELLSDNLCELSKCTRLEIIDSNGRSYTNWNEKNKIDLSVQDDGQTLKIFISKRQ